MEDVIMSVDNSTPFPIEDIKNVCYESIQDRILNINDVKCRLGQIALHIVGSFTNHLYLCHETIINSILKQYPYRRTKDIEYMSRECSAIYGVLATLLHSDNYFVLDNERQIFKFNKFYWRRKRTIFYRPLIRTMLLVDYNIVKYRVEYLTDIIVKILFDSLNNTEFFEAEYDIHNKCIKSDMRNMSAAAKLQFKCLILDYLLYSDLKQCEIAKILGVDRKTVRNIQKKLEKNPNLTYEDLVEKKHGPQKKDYTKISESAWNAFEVACKSLPRDFGLQYAGWSTQAIRAYFFKEHDIIVTRNYLRYYLRKRNYTSKVGQRKNPKQDPNKIEKFKSIDYERELTVAKENGECIVFEDEMYDQQGHGNESYSKRNTRSLSSYHQSAKHTNHSLITFIGIDGFLEIFPVEGPIDSGWILFYLKKIKKMYPEKKFLIFMDNSSVHDSQILRSWLKRKNGGKGFIRIAYLPEYCPEMNPVEFFNNDFHNHLEKLNLESSKDVVNATYDYINWYMYSKNDDHKNDKKSKIHNFFFAESCKYSVDIYNKVFGTNLQKIDRKHLS